MQELIPIVERLFGQAGLVIFLIPLAVQMAISSFVYMRDFLSDKTRMEKEKQRLELVKLSLEIEVLKKNNQLTDIELPFLDKSVMQRGEGVMRMFPRFAPRDGIDMLIGAAMAPYFLVLILSPPVLVGVLFKSLWWFLAGYVVWSFVLLSDTVWRLEISSTGVCFVRLFGMPKFLPWSEIKAVKKVTRAEIVRAWFWPILPKREPTYTISARDHYRIEWATGFAYFPPKDIQAFERYVVNKVGLM